MIWLLIYTIGFLAMLEYLLHYGLQQPEFRTRKICVAAIMGVLWPVVMALVVSAVVLALVTDLVGELLLREKVDKE